MGTTVVKTDIIGFRSNETGGGFASAPTQQFMPMGAYANSQKDVLLEQ
jgi:hypothetical protein